MPHFTLILWLRRQSWLPFSDRPMYNVLEYGYVVAMAVYDNGDSHPLPPGWTLARALPMDCCRALAPHNSAYAQPGLAPNGLALFWLLWKLL